VRMLYVVEIITPFCNSGHTAPMSYEEARKYQMWCADNGHGVAIREWCEQEGES